MQIRRATIADGDALWAIYSEVIETGDAFVDTPEITRKEDMLRYWLEDVTAWVAEESPDLILGAYYLRANQPGRGSHMANATYMVRAAARGKGVGEALGRHSLAMARETGFMALQFNAVVSTNTAAVNLWKRLGFEIIGTIPRGFQHRDMGLVDLYVMYQWL